MGQEENQCSVNNLCNSRAAPFHEAPDATTIPSTVHRAYMQPRSGVERNKLSPPLEHSPSGVLPEQESIRAQLNVFELKGIENKSVSVL